jgi:imidazolonepropionase-like amidohydrolase
MKQAISAALVAFLLAACTGAGTPGAAAAGAPRLVIQTARLLDPATGADRRDMVVVVEGSRIAEVESVARYRPRPEDRRINLGQATLLPGLIDAHVHLSIGGPPRAAAVATVRAGFTTVADLGAASQRVQVVRDSIAAGAWEGPRVLAAGLWIGMKGGVCEFGGIGVAGGPDAFRARVRENIAAGADLIKACVTGWPAVAWAHPDSAELGPAILAALVDEAHRAGRPVAAHALSAEGVRRALDAGIDGLVHAAFLDGALARRMRDRGLWLIPTLASLTRGDSSPPALGLIEAVGTLYRSGVMLVYGTDGGVLPHGRNAEEAIALAAAGVPATEILRAATVNAAKALGLADSVGAIRRGMVADLIAVPGDPRADLRVLERPSFVMARGRVVVGERAH